MSEDEYNDNEDNEDNFGLENEGNAFERAGGGGDLLLNSLRGIKFRDRNSKDQFYTTVNGIFNKLIELEIPFVNRNDQENILKYIDSLEKPGYKNALCYILGYYASNNGRDINIENINTIWKELPYIQKQSGSYPMFNIKKQDVLRYSRLWLSIK